MTQFFMKPIRDESLNLALRISKSSIAVSARPLDLDTRSITGAEMRTALVLILSS